MTEYKSMRINVDYYDEKNCENIVIDKCNELAKDGWKMVSVVPCFFKNSPYSIVLKQVTVFFERKSKK